MPYANFWRTSVSGQRLLRLHGSNCIGVCVPTEIVCKPSTLTPIKYIFYESFLNIDSIFGFRFDHYKYNKRHQQNFCDGDVGHL